MTAIADDAAHFLDLVAAYRDAAGVTELVEDDGSMQCSGCHRAADLYVPVPDPNYPAASWMCCVRCATREATA